ncbi:hypothetical protein BH11PSE2_BH11PSE2_06780 [soil metagenome]
MIRLIRGLLLAAAITVAGLAAPNAFAASPKFPALTGRVVDDAKVLSPATEASLSDKLEGLEKQTGRQVVVATVPSLQGYEIEDFGYQLGRAWAIGDKTKDDGVVFLVAPSEHKVRIEVGYGLEPELTDALSNVILQTKVLPKFKSGDIEAGVVGGTEAIVEQLALPDDQAKANVAAVAAKPANRSPGAFPGVIVFIIFIVIITLISRGRSGRGGGGGLGSALPWLLLGALNSRGGGGGGGGGWSSGGGGGGWSSGGGGGGFSGGGGSFGGGGSSGRW